jgi:3-deoxy-manno-octulosonate cytidylyltransferase (CMP-KDO synthetase)
MRAAAVIPARYASTRFPGKPLASLTGRPMIVHVLEKARQCATIGRILVATDDERIARAVHAAGFEARMTRADHPNGTCRIEEVARTLDEDLVVNIQGDEPQIEPALVDLTVRTLEAHPDAPMATLVSPFAPGEDPANPNIVKCVRGVDGRALYFSRSPIPFARDGGADAQAPLKHIGLYVYRRAFLRTFVTLPATPLERTESLEQLRALEHGHTIVCALGEAHFTGIDTPEQYAAFVARVAGGAGGAGGAGSAGASGDARPTSR